MKLTSITTLLCTIVLLLSAMAFAAPLDKIQFIKISPQDAKAVIKDADGKLVVIKPGDAVGEGVTVREIAAGRIVLEEKTDKGQGTIIVRMDGGKTRIERLQQMPEKSSVTLAPAISGK